MEAKLAKYRDFVFVGSYYYSLCLLTELISINLLPSCIITIKGNDDSQYIFYKKCSLIEEFKQRIITIDKPEDLLSLQTRRHAYLLTAGFPYLLPDNIIKLASNKAVNAHPSLLPRWRGPDPIRNAMINNDKYFRITLHEMTQEYDSGNIVAQRA